MSVAYLSLGSNLGDRLRLIQEAVAALTVEAGPVTALSSFYETEPWGFSSPHRFLNVALALEQKLGRTRKSTDGGYADRTIDIDLLMIDDVIVDTPELSLPHPRLHLRRFVLEPLCEIAPELYHPILKKTISQLFSDL